MWTACVSLENVSVSHLDLYGVNFPSDTYCHDVAGHHRYLPYDLWVSLRCAIRVISCSLGSLSHL